MHQNGNEIQIDHQGPVAVLNIRGDITALSLNSLEEAYATASEDGAAKLLFRIDRESYINSGGIAVLIQILARTRQKGQQAAITGISDHFKKIFKMVGITRFASLSDSLEEALQSLS
jgi:anti-anti-sigma factor